MKFYVIWSDGRKFGPADIPTLIQWAQEGRLNRETMVENAETGQQGRARDIQGMTWPTNAPTTDIGGGDPTLKAGEKPLAQRSSFDIPGQPKPYIAGQPVSGSEPQQRPTPAPQTHQDPLRPQQAQPNPYQQAPQAGSPYPRDAAYDRHIDDGSQKMVTNAWIMTVVSFVLCGCFIISPFAIYTAKRAKLMGNQNAQAPFVAAWIVLAIELLGWGTYFTLVGLAVAQGGTWSPPGQ
jgi:hypothetical protein